MCVHTRGGPEVKAASGDSDGFEDALPVQEAWDWGGGDLRL